MARRTDQEIVESLCDIEEGLSEWEVDFVESIAKSILDEKKSLSIKQRRVAEEILDRE